MSDIHVHTGGADNDTIYGDAGQDLIKGEGGNDVLAGQAGADSLYGGDGNDYLIGGTGDDVLFGGGGVDWADYAAAASAVRLDLRIAAAQDTGGAGHDTLRSVERIFGSAFADALTGNKFDNLLHGADGADTLNGGEGRDSLIGDGGDDVLVGGRGIDYFEGGAGNDTYVVNHKLEQVVELHDGGVDTVKTNGSHHLEANVENLTLLGSGNLNGWGNALANLITGNDGDNLLFGNDGDTLAGGQGHDTFMFNADATGVVSVSFDGSATIDVSRIDADVSKAGNQAFHSSPDGEHFSGHAGEVAERFISSSSGSGGDGVLGFYFDTDGDKLADFSVVVDVHAGVFPDLVA